MWETWGQSLGWEDPLETGRVPTLVFWPGEFHGVTGSDMTEQLSLFTQNTSHLYGMGSREQQFFQIAADILNLFLLSLIIFLCHCATCRLIGCLMQRHGTPHQ